MFESWLHRVEVQRLIVGSALRVQSVRNSPVVAQLYSSLVGVSHCLESNLIVLDDSRLQVRVQVSLSHTVRLLSHRRQIRHTGTYANRGMFSIY
jgi:hypothetical protein